jgi:hypothetical protein
VFERRYIVGAKEIRAIGGSEQLASQGSWACIGNADARKVA